MTGYLRLRHLAKSYDGKTNAVDDISIDIARGEFVTFLGPSGSGKTTTLLMIAGFETPSRGVIELDGRDLALSKPYRRNIGIVFQNYALFPHMTAFDNVVFPLRMRHFPKQELRERAEKMLRLVGLSNFAQRYPGELSGGQQQRVALARGLVFDPDLVLLDEPLGALDKSLREHMQVEIKRIHRELGVTMIYVTHDQTEAMTMSDRIAVFSGGRIAQLGSPLDIYNRPANRFVAEFIGDSNIFAGRIDPAHPGMVELAGIGMARVDGTDATSGSVDLMIRPERLRPPPSGCTEHANTIEMMVDDVINYGESLLVIGKTHGLPVRARLVGAQAGAAAAGSVLRLAWFPADAHILARSARVATDHCHDDGE
jgi:putative spermidine/putrescine transport system ATP-binding protein